MKKNLQFDSWHKKTFDLVVNNVDLSNKKILDIGCNNFNFFKYLKLKGYSGKWIGYDVIKYNDDFLFTNNLKKIKDDFDVITMLDVIEHITLDEFEDYLKWIKEHLNGYLIIITPNINNIFNQFWEDEGHIRPYSMNSLVNVLKSNDFEVTKKKKSHYSKNAFKLLFCKLMNIDIYCKLFVVAKRLKKKKKKTKGVSIPRNNSLKTLFSNPRKSKIFFEMVCVLLTIL